jgi:hypothetical protein
MHQAETNQPQQPPEPRVFKTKNGDSIMKDDYISIRFIKDITLLAIRFPKEFPKQFNQGFYYDGGNVMQTYMQTYKANTVLVGTVGNINYSNSGFTFQYTTSSYNVSINLTDEETINLTDEETIKIEKINEAEYHKKRAEEQVQEEIKAKNYAIINKHGSLKDEDDALDFLIEYTPDTKTPEEICLLISQNPYIFKKLHGLGILPHRIASTDTHKIKKNQSYQCNESNEPVRSTSAVAVTNIASLFIPRTPRLVPSTGGKKSKKRKTQKRKTQKKKNTKKEKHKKRKTQKKKNTKKRKTQK